MKAKYFILAGVLATAVFCSGSVNAESVASTQTAALMSQLQLQIQALLQQIATLQAQSDSQTTPQTISQDWCYTFEKNLGYANSGKEEVGYLHIALEKEGFSYAPDTGNTYRTGTANAVRAFQEKYASEILTPFRMSRGNGYVGTKTREKLNQLYSCENRTHTECANSQCVAVSGAGLNTCLVNEDCVVASHTECNTQGQCVAVSGSGTDECFTSSDCTTQPSITVTSPNGGETWQAGTTHNITWTYNGTNPLMIELCRDSISTCWHLAYNISPTANSYSWTVDSVLPIGSVNQSSVANDYKIHVWEQTNASVSDYSDNYFSIVSAPTCIPNWTCTSWNSCSVKNQLILNHIAQAQAEIAQTTDPQKILALTAKLNQLQALIYVSATARTCTDSNNCGVITGEPALARACTTQPSITVTSPNGGETWTPGQNVTITWTSSGMDDSKVFIQVENSNPYSIASGIPASQGSYTWTVKDVTNFTMSRQVKVRIGGHSSNNVYADDASDNYFSIVEPNNGNLVAHYSLEGNANDVSGNNNNGFVYGSPAKTTGKVGQNYDFDGINDYIYIPHTANPIKKANKFSVSAWIKPNVFITNSNYDIVNYDLWDVDTTGWRLRYEWGALVFRYGSFADKTDFYLLQKDKWSFITLTFDNGSVGLYIDGELKKSVNHNSTITYDSWNRLFIGKYPGNGYRWRGGIDEVKFWDYALSAQEVVNEYNSVPAEPSITVISPNGGEEWKIGKTHDITWMTNNIPAANDMLVRLRDSAGVEHYFYGNSDISNTVPNNGFFSITVPSTLTPGQYKVEVKTSVNGQSYLDASDNYFNIVSSVQPLAVISPKAENSYAPGETINLKWSGGTSDSEINFYLFTRDSYGSDEYNFKEVMIFRAPNTGSSSWNIPSNITPGVNYYVRALCYDAVGCNNIYDSGPFTITVPTGSLATSFANTPQNQVVAGGQTVEVGRWKFSSSYENYTIQEIRIDPDATPASNNAEDAIASLILRKTDGTILDRKSWNASVGYFKFDGLSLEVPANTSQTVVVQAVLSPAISATAGNSGLRIVPSLVYTKYTNSQGDPKIDETPRPGNSTYVYRSIPTLSRIDFNNTAPLVNGVVQDLYRFTVAAPYQGDVYIKQFKLDLNWSDNGTDNNLELESLKVLKNGVDITGTVFIVERNGNSIEDDTGVLENNSKIIVIWVSGEDIIPAGSSAIYTLKGTPQGFGDSDNVTVAFNTDSNDVTFGSTSVDYIGYLNVGATNTTGIIKLYSTSTPDAAAEDAQLIWSDGSAVIHSASGMFGSNDWTNGYLIGNSLSGETWSSGSSGLGYNALDAIQAQVASIADAIKKLLRQ